MTKGRLKETGPKDAATSKGPNAKAVEAIALAGGYTTPDGAGKPMSAPADDAGRAGGERGRSGGARARNGKAGVNAAQAVYCDPAGRKWAYRGKRARVMVMLATSGTGLTQWDTLPWHTRLGGTIHALRRDGLVIDTEREGDYRHARYRLRTPGRLVTAANTDAAAPQLGAAS